MELFEEKDYFIVVVYFPSAADQQSTKRQTSEKSEKLDYLIRDALDRECPPLIKRDGNIF